MTFRQKVLSGVAWRTFSSASQLILQIGFTVILARLLSKSDFGLVAMALLFTGFVRAVTAVGFGSAIIQDQEISNPQVSAVFVFHIVISVAISLICYLSAPLAASFFGEPALNPVVRALSWSLLISGLSFPTILLRKRMEFGKFSVLEVFSMIVGNLVGVSLALWGFGVWSLVWRQLCQRSIMTAGSWAICSWRPCKPQFVGTRHHWNFGLHIMGSSIATYFSQNMVAVIIGRFFGAETLGAFRIAYNLAILPAEKIKAVLDSVFTSAFATLQKDLANFRGKLGTALFSLSLFLFPLMLGLAAVAEHLVPLVYGDHWAEAGVFLSILAPIGLLKGTEHLLRTALIAIGSPNLVFRITIAETIIAAPLMYLGVVNLGITGLIVAYLVVSLCSFLLATYFVQTAVSDKKLVVRTCARSLFAAVMMFLLLSSINKYGLFAGATGLLIQTFVGGVFYALTRFLLFSQGDVEYSSTLPYMSRLMKRKRSR